MTAVPVVRLRRPKDRLLREVGLLLECAGTNLSWPELETAMRRLNLRELNSLKYRIERGISNAYEEGRAAGRQDVS